MRSLIGRVCNFNKKGLIEKELQDEKNNHKYTIAIILGIIFLIPEIGKQ